METKVLEYDIAGGITDVHLEKVYASCRVLVRYHKRPMTWIWISNVNSDILPAHRISEAVRHHLQWPLAQKFVAGELGITPAFEKNQDPISVVVCTRNRASWLTKCLHALKQLDYDQYEIIVVDNAPTDNSTLEVARAAGVRYVLEPRPGLDWARNKGIAEAKHDLVAFSDDDACPDKFWLRFINENFRSTDTMCVTGLVAPAELRTGAQKMFELNYGGMSHGFKKRTIQRKNLSERQLLWASNFGVGVNMAYRKKVFEEIGVFDTRLDVGTPTRGGGDVEMMHRLVAAGCKLVYDPAVIVYHHHRADYAQLKKQINDNGRSLGCFLINCFVKRTVRRRSVIRFFFVDWFLRWNMHNMRHNKKVPRSYFFEEVKGIFRSPMAYWESSRNNRRIIQQHQS